MKYSAVATARGLMLCRSLSIRKKVQTEFDLHTCSFVVQVLSQSEVLEAQKVQDAARNVR